MNLSTDRFSQPLFHEGRDYDTEEDLELEKADHDNDLKSSDSNVPSPHPLPG